MERNTPEFRRCVDRGLLDLLSKRDGRFWPIDELASRRFEACSGVVSAPELPRSSFLFLPDLSLNEIRGHQRFAHLFARPFLIYSIEARLRLEWDSIAEPYATSGTVQTVSGATFDEIDFEYATSAAARVMRARLCGTEFLGRGTSSRCC